METKVNIFGKKVHVRFTGLGMMFCDMALSPEQAATLAHQLIDTLDTYTIHDKNK